MKSKELLAIGASLFLGSCSSLVIATSFPGLDRTRLTADQAARLTVAETDFHRVRSGREAVHAQLEQTLRDGGTKIYRGNGYDLVSRHSIEHRDGTVGHIVGPSITLDRAITGGAPIHYEETRFVAFSQ